jgi:hypothetical protein
LCSARSASVRSERKVPSPWRSTSSISFGRPPGLLQQPVGPGEGRPGAARQARRRAHHSFQAGRDRPGPLAQARGERCQPLDHPGRHPAAVERGRLREALEAGAPEGPPPNVVVEPNKESRGG